MWANLRCTVRYWSRPGQYRQHECSKSFVTTGHTRKEERASSYQKPQRYSANPIKRCVVVSCLIFGGADLLDIHVASHPRPVEKIRDQYHIYKFATIDNPAFSSYFPPRLLQAINDSALWAWEMRKSSTETEIVRTDVPWSAFEDCMMFLEVGSAQGIIAMLFTPDKRTPCPSCCE